MRSSGQDGIAASCPQFLAQRCGAQLCRSASATWNCAQSAPASACALRAQNEYGKLWCWMAAPPQVRCSGWLIPGQTSAIGPLSLGAHRGHNNWALRRKDLRHDCRIDVPASHHSSCGARDWTGHCSLGRVGVPEHPAHGASVKTLGKWHSSLRTDCRWHTGRVGKK